jgi:hypothetical protein
VWNLQEEIIMFLETKCEAPMFSRLKDENLKTDRPFVVNIMGNLDNMNVILQGKASLMHESYAA